MFTFALLLAAASPEYAFDFKTATDPFDDSVRGIASTTFPDGAFIIKCDKPGPESVYVHIYSDKFLGGGGRTGGLRALTYRVGSSKAETVIAYYDGNDAMLRGATAYNLLTAMIGQRKVAIRAVKYDGSFVDMIIPYRNYISPMLKAAKQCDPQNFGKIADVEDGSELPVE